MIRLLLLQLKQTRQTEIKYRQTRVKLRYETLDVK